jgi:serine/threonine protein kinase
MEPLRSSDPARVADHRLLGRLGAGGMGVVYLARTPGGALVALKVLLAEYAEEPGFKERFRREVAVARRVHSPWAVPLVDADPDADAPWLATAFVPGPSLGEAVAAHGPLAEHGVRLLGARLAEALGEVHRAGLVHRDLKPGNVLIAHDGPRLIDFGIARAPEDTALTATGLVVGTSDRRATCSPSAVSWRSRRPGGRRSAGGRSTPCCTGPCTTRRTSTGCRHGCARWWRAAWRRSRPGGPKSSNWQGGWRTGVTRGTRTPPGGCPSRSPG